MPRVSSNLTPVYCRREPTTDATAKAHLTPEQLATCRDWVYYHDPKCERFYCRTPWHYTKSGPRRSRKTIRLNCYLYRLVWVD